MIQIDVIGLCALRCTMKMEVVNSRYWSCENSICIHATSNVDINIRVGDVALVFKSGFSISIENDFVIIKKHANELDIASYATIFIVNINLITRGQFQNQSNTLHSVTCITYSL